jgi:transcriptional regulator with XRE-family HTH domain
MISDNGDKAKLFRPFVQILAETRKANYLTQAGLSESAGYSRKYVTLIESGERVPSLEALIAIASCAGVPRETIENLLEEYMDHFEWKEED